MADTKAKTTSDESPSKGRSIDDLEDDISRLREDIATLADTLKGIAADQYGAAKKQVNTQSAQARRQAEEAISSVRPMVEQNPWTSMLVLLGLGFVLGSLMRR